MRANSLALRLFLWAAVTTLAIILVTGIVLSSLYRQAVERAFDGAGEDFGFAMPARGMIQHAMHKKRKILHQSAQHGLCSLAQSGKFCVWGEASRRHHTTLLVPVT